MDTAVEKLLAIWTFGGEHDSFKTISCQFNPKHEGAIPGANSLQNVLGCNTDVTAQPNSIFREQFRNRIRLTVFTSYGVVMSKSLIAACTLFLGYFGVANVCVAQASVDVQRENTPVFVEPVIPDAKFSDADYRVHIAKLRKRLPHSGFHVVVQKPFVVIGDEKASVVEQRSRHTVKWAVDLLKKDFFAEDPDAIIEIWLFKDKTSYEKHNKELFGSLPTTPYGFYSSSDQALVMNIATGGGTLVHEIVHPFIESNFSECPSWFNEGLASLYEQCSEKKGKIWGSTNWRLRGLQGAIESNRVGSFQDLCSTTTRQFYREDRGTNYSQARYLCFYLQEKGLLRKYYKSFRKNVGSDPTGYETLVSVLGSPNMEQFELAWRKYVMTLRF